MQYPLEIMREILSFESIDLKQASMGTYVLQRTETHPICKTLTHMIDTKWKLDDDCESAYGDWCGEFESSDILRYYHKQAHDGFVYKHCGLRSGFMYIYVLCVKNNKIVFQTTQKFHRMTFGNIGGFMCEQTNISRKDEQPSHVYYTKCDEIEDATKHTKYNLWIPDQTCIQQ
jgi:hypothetical protein